MKVLGLSAFYHDSAAALVVDGQVIAASSEERFTRIKHDSSFPLFASNFCLEAGCISPSELDYVSYYEDPNVRFSRTLATSISGFPRSRNAFVSSMRDAISVGLRVKSTIASHLDVDPSRIRYVPHHLSHAANAFYSSTFRESAILTIDAIGEWACTALFHGDGNGIDPIDAVFYPHSLGLVYSAFTSFLGFQANDGECSTMALAAFGSPRFVDKLRHIIKLRNNGTYEVDCSYFAFDKHATLPVTAKFYKVFGNPRAFGTPLSFNSMQSNQNASSDEQRFADIAASLQVVLEEAILGLVRYAKEKTGSANLCLAGGVILNAVSTAKIVNSGIFENVFIPIDPGDGGSAIGAALYLTATNLSQIHRQQPISAYLGKSYDESPVVHSLKKLDSGILRKFTKSDNFRNIQVERIQNESDLLQYVSSSLRSGKIVAWLQGRFENGPRALGNRSILCNPARTDVAMRLSQKVKLRAPFRPYAFSVAADEATNLLNANNPPPSATKWMQISAAIPVQHHKNVAAALHIDGTSRPQVCSREDNPRFFGLLKTFGATSGVPAILNTSFNESGSPLVSSPAEALMMFLRTDIDILVLNDTAIERRVDA